MRILPIEGFDTFNLSNSVVVLVCDQQIARCGSRNGLGIVELGCSTRTSIP